MEGFINKAEKEALLDILNLQKTAFESVAIVENNFNIPPMSEHLFTRENGFGANYNVSN